MEKSPNPDMLAASEDISGLSRTWVPVTPTYLTLSTND